MIILGRIVAPFGVQGWIRVHPYGDDPVLWKEMPHWWLSESADTALENWVQYRQDGCRMHGKGLVARLNGFTTRDAAEAVKGWFIAAPRTALPRTAHDEYYWGDLIGLDVVTESGDTLGTVASLLSTSVHDVLQVRDGDTERLIPFVAAWVLDVDLAARRIRTAWQKDW